MRPTRTGEFARTINADYPVLSDPERKVASLYGVIGLGMPGRCAGRSISAATAASSTSTSRSRPRPTVAMSRDGSPSSASSDGRSRGNDTRARMRRWIAAFGVVVFAIVSRAPRGFQTTRIFRFERSRTSSTAGLRWNPDERVQSYTHPLWLLVVSPRSTPSHGNRTSRSWLFSAICSIAAVGVLILPSRGDPFPCRIRRGGAGPVGKASPTTETSGLENPLSRLLLVLVLEQASHGRHSPSSIGHGDHGSPC